jgi:hypothetical protein
MGITGHPLSICEKLNVMNKVNGVPNVPCTRITEELDIPVRKVTGKVLGWSYRGESFHLPKTAADYTNSAYISNN